MGNENCIHDIMVIGGGINGVGIALDSVGRGLKVVLCEMNDLASATSSSSSKLIHGGLRYLEHYDFRLVREGLAEREVLLKNAPHIIAPLRFRLPHQPHLRPAWMIRAGLFLYDHLSKRVTLPSSHGIKFGADGPLVSSISKGFEYSDGWVDDSRLVVLNAMAAREKGALVKTRSRCIKAERQGDLWQVTIENTLTGEVEQLQARALVNAAGPWVADLFDSALKTQSPQNIRLIRGSHIIVPRIHDEPQAYILQNDDHRIVFVIPYEEDFSLIGTTDIEHKGEPGQVEASVDEIDYLITVVNNYFKHQISTRDIVKTYSGVRPLLDDESDSPQAVTRDYTFELDSPKGKAPLMSIFGGKITTYRKLSESAVNSLGKFFPAAGPAWTTTSPVHGGDFKDRHSLEQSVLHLYSWLPVAIISRLVRSYGTLCQKILDNTNSLADLGQHFGAGLYQKEVDYLISREWVMTLEDLLWRRSKLGLFLSNDQQNTLEIYLHQALGQPKIEVSELDLITVSNSSPKFHANR